MCCTLVDVPEAFILIFLPDLSAETLIRSLKRFICRRGIPKLVVSYNAQTFQTVAKYLSSLFELPEVQGFLLNHKIK